MKRAIFYASRIENGLFKIFATGFDREGFELARMTEFVRKMGAAGVTLSDFTREFKNVDAGLRSKRLGTLVDGKDLYSFPKPTPGRTAQILIHREYLDAYKKEHPDQMEKHGEKH